MVIVFDKRTTPNITEILWNGAPVSVFNWSVTDDSTCAFDYEGFRIIVGATGVEVRFNSAEALEPYHNQYHMYISGAFNPVTDGYKTDPKNDHIPTGSIVSHNYENTDIEKDLIDGNN